MEDLVNKERREILEKYSIATLRELGRNLSLKVATELSKEELIEEILLMLYGSEILPSLAVEENSEEVEEDDDDDYDNSSYSYSYGSFNVASIASGRLSSGTVKYDLGHDDFGGNNVVDLEREDSELTEAEKKNLKTFFGFVEETNGDFKIRYATDFTLDVSPEQVKLFGLKNFDTVEFTAFYSASQKRSYLLNVLTVNGVKPNLIARAKFEELKLMPPTNVFELNDNNPVLNVITKFTKVAKGSRVLIVGEDDNCRVRVMDEIHNTFETGGYETVYLLIDKLQDVEDLIERNTERAVFISSGETPDEKLKKIVVAFMRAERAVEMGQDIVMVVDDFNKVVEILECLITTENTNYITALVNKFFNLGGAYSNGGSLTIFASIDESSLKLKEWLKRSSTLFVPLSAELAKQKVYPAINIGGIDNKLESFYMDEGARSVAEDMKKIVESHSECDYIRLIKELKNAGSVNKILKKLKSCE